MKCTGIFIVTLLCIVNAHAFTWTPCDVGKVPFTPDVVQLVPDPPAAGGQVAFKIGGNAGERGMHCDAMEKLILALLGASVASSGGP